jgi:ABC-type nitrate/sulfonate/bicarbonate transport system ATPase subunit
VSNNNSSLVSIRDLSFRYGLHASDILADVTLDIPRGSFCAIVGRSGTGKSTLLNILSGYLLASRGTICIQGKPLSGPSTHRIPIYQEDGLWPWLRVWENVLLAELLRSGQKSIRKRRDQAENLLIRTGLLPDTHAKYPKELSVGMRKRVEIARALFTKPQLILADEPFSSLDEATRADLHQLIIELWTESGVTVVFSTHDLDEALFLATHIVVMSKNNPSKVVGIYSNSLHGRIEARRKSAQQYYALYDTILSAM